MHKNKQIILFLAILFLAGMIVFAGGPVRKKLIDPSKAPKPYADGEVLVSFKKGIDLNTVNNVTAAHSLKLKKHFKVLSKVSGKQFVLLNSPRGVDAMILAKALRSNPNVESASPNYRREMCATPNDTNFTSLWGMHNTGQTGGTADADIDAPEAWDITTGSSSVVVAIIDSGIDYNHPDLAANVWRNTAEYSGTAGVDDDDNGYTDDIYGIDPAGADGSETNPGDTDPMDGIGHGSHCAGTIGAVGNNNLGVAGVNWNVKLMGLKFFGDYDGGGWDADAIECMNYIIDQKNNYGQNIVAINASWGGTSTAEDPGPGVDALRDAIEIVTNAGIVFCAAAGNGGSDGIGDNNDGGTHHYPSDYTLPGIISVAATDHNDALGDFSNYGATSVDIGAPGVGILSTVPGAFVSHAGDVFFDDMEGTADNWVTSGTNNTWAITTEYETYWGGSYPAAPSPTHFWSDSPGSEGGYGIYLPQTNSFLTLKNAIDLSGYLGQDVYLGIWLGRHIERNDHLYLEISADGGANWTQLNDWANTAGSVYFWAYFYWEIPEGYKSNNFKMRFNFVSDRNNQGLGVVIDNVGIVTELYYGYESWNGTSMATPHVAGAVALIASQYGSETVAQRKARILNWGDYKTALNGTTVTCKRLNVYRSLHNPTVTVTSPNGGESWMVNTTRQITWTSYGAVNNLDIHYSLNNGGTWTLIAGNEANDGLYDWTIPSVTPSTNCLIRIQETGCSTLVTDQSDAVFSIIAYAAEAISTPGTPTGQGWAMINVSNTYTADGSASNWGDAVEYRFDWGDGTYSDWPSGKAMSAAHYWSATGTYNVRAQARCSIHLVESAWSASLPVVVYDQPTWAAITRFDASAEAGQPTVEWHTAGEAGAVGFNLWRQDRETKEYTLVNSSLLPALTATPQGGVYRFADTGAFPGEPVTYRLEEIDAQGRMMSYGPFTVTFGIASPDTVGPDMRLGREQATDIYGFQRYPREQSLFEQERLNARRHERLQALPAVGDLAGAGKERVRVTVKGQGLFYVTAAQIASSLNIAEAAVAALIGNYNLKLTGLGREIAWLADRNGAGLFFYNEGRETPYYDRNVYFLEKGGGLAMATTGAGNAGIAPDGQTYMENLSFAEGHYFVTSQEDSTLSDSWFWDYVVAGSRERTFALNAPGAAATGQATLKVILRGGTDTAAEFDHHATVTLNGSRIGEATWDGGNAYVLEATFSASQLADGANSVLVSGALDTGAPYSIFYVDRFELSYPRYYRAVNNSLVCRGDGNAVVTVAGFSELDIVALDVSKPESPVQLVGVAPDVSGRVTFVPGSANNAYIISGLNAALRPLAVGGAGAGQMSGSGQSVEYVVIAPEAFATTAQELADYRQRKGLKAKVVLLEDIYDAYSYGVPNPYAIRDFLTKVYGKKLKYVVLAGKGTYDYKDYMGKGDNLVPALLGKTGNGFYAADRIYGDVKGSDGVPEIAIGRLPAVTNAELQAMIAKIKAYESGQGEWTGKALFIADNADGGGDFALCSDGLAALATGFRAEKLYLAGSASELRGQIAAAWSAGAALVGYCGHAGMNQLAEENLLDVATAMGLRNGGQLPLAVMLTCVTGRFEVPGFTSLGEALLLNAEGGMAGGLVPSGTAMNSDSLRLGEAFCKAAMRQGTTVGQALLEAMKAYVQQGGDAYLLNVYNWLGDPALEFK